VAEYRLLLAAKPDEPEALNNLAWLLAASPDSTVRNGADAVRFAERGCRLTGYERAPMLATLAAAYAEAGQFTQAVTTAQRAIALARAGGDARLATMFEQLLRLYQAGKPYHMPAPGAPRPSP
jgi:tetratricopeptide (TPR) repeat protein